MVARKIKKPDLPLKMTSGGREFERHLDGPYYYRCTRAGGSSSRYGACEVCRESCPDVYYQVELKLYWPSHKRADGPSLTAYECLNLFGHEACVRGQRRAT